MRGKQPKCKSDVYCDNNSKCYIYTLVLTVQHTIYNMATQCALYNTRYTTRATRHALHGTRYTTRAIKHAVYACFTHTIYTTYIYYICLAFIHIFNYIEDVLENILFPLHQFRVFFCMFFKCVIDLLITSGL